MRALAALAAMAVHAVDHAALVVARDDGFGKAPPLEAAWRQQSGGTAAAVVPHGAPALEGCGRLDVDPAGTNPVSRREARARAGVTLLAAAERPSRVADLPRCAWVPADPTTVQWARRSPR